MTIQDTHGTSIHTPTELVRILSDRLGLTFVERERVSIPSKCGGFLYEAVEPRASMMYRS